MELTREVYVGVKNKPDSIIGFLIGLFTKNYCHAFVIIKEFGKYYVYEMKGFGIYRTLFVDSYKYKQGWEIGELNLPIKEKQYEKMLEYCRRIHDEKAKYNHLTILTQLFYFITGRYTILKSHKQICSELVANVLNEGFNNICANPQTVTPLSLRLNKNLHYSNWNFNFKIERV
jgi:hypothetical protein